MENYPIRATRSLPVNYVLRSRFSARDRRTLLALNVAGFGLLFLFGWLFISIAIYLRPSDAAAALTSAWLGLPPLVAIFGVLVLFAIVVYLHEGIHGLGFWLATRTRPVFGMRNLYFFAAAPDWYIPRNSYLLIGLAPLLVISALCIFMMAVIPREFISAFLILAVMNASGAVGDLWVAVLLLRQPADALANDRGDEIRIYAPHR
jgi:hypothetical protein